MHIVNKNLKTNADRKQWEISMSRPAISDHNNEKHHLRLEEEVAECFGCAILVFKMILLLCFFNLKVIFK